MNKLGEDASALYNLFVQIFVHTQKALTYETALLILKDGMDTVRDSILHNLVVCETADCIQTCPPPDLIYQNITEYCTICANNGQCTFDDYVFVCACQPAWFGDNCEEPKVICLHAPCRNNGTCHQEFGGFRCECPLDYTGKHCEHEIQECPQHLGDPNPCQNGGVCTPCYLGNCSGYGYTCACPFQFEGYNCHTAIDNCDPNPCKNNGNCKIAEHRIYCECAINPTYMQPYFKGPEYQCIPKSAGYIENIEDCEETLENFERNNNDCSIPQTQCDYDPLAFNQSVDTQGTLPCKNGGTCSLDPHKQVPPGWACTCTPDFVGSTCQLKIDENDKCFLAGTACFHGTCDVAETCACFDGWQGKFCHIDINECEITPPICMHGSVCLNHEQTETSKLGYTCDCSNVAFTGDQCQEPASGCSNDPCSVQNSQAYACELDETDIGFRCRCNVGWWGDRCEIDARSCDDVNLCKHGSICKVHQASIGGVERPVAFCACKEGYEGPRCEHRYNTCLPPPCGSYGKCQETDLDYECICDEGWQGEHCNDNIDDCLSATCQNNGRCIDGIASYTCDCPNEATGHHCEHLFTPCDSYTKCQHNSLCIDTIEADWIQQEQICYCQEGWYGTNCEQKIETYSNQYFFFGLLIGSIVFTCVVFICLAIKNNNGRKYRKHIILL